MRKEREALLVAALAGLVIVGAAAFVVQLPTGGKLQGTVTQLGAIATPSATEVSRTA